MENNWQLLDMFADLQGVWKRCGGDIHEVSAKRLSIMTALELMELLAPNDIRFCIEKQDGVIRKYREGKHPYENARIGKDFYIEHFDKAFQLKTKDQIPWRITYDEMEKLVAFVEALK